MWKRNKQTNRKRAIMERKCFVWRGFEHITQHYRNRREIEENRKAKVRGLEHWPSSNKFKVLTSKVIVVAITNQRKPIASLSSLKSKSLVGIIRELNKKSLYCFPIYTNGS